MHLKVEGIKRGISQTGKEIGINGENQLCLFDLELICQFKKASTFVPYENKLFYNSSYSLTMVFVVKPQ